MSLLVVRLGRNFVDAAMVQRRRSSKIPNSHMLMQDRNSLDIAGWLLAWIERST